MTQPTPADLEPHIADTSEWSSDPDEPVADLMATREPQGQGIEFHVSMHDYTMRDMERLIVEAAARMLLGGYGDARLRELVQEKCIEQVSAKADAVLATVTAEIIDQPVISALGRGQPVTMRDFIALTGREYLTQTVDREGKPTISSYNSAGPRISQIVSAHMSRAFAREIEAATNAAVREVQAAVAAEHKRIIEAEKARFLAALNKVAA
mgnify:FL=1